MLLESKRRNKSLYVHNFWDESPKFRILAGFVIIKKPLIYYAMNILWLTFLFLYFPYMLMTGFITLFSEEFENKYFVDILPDMCFFVAIPLIAAVANVTREKLNLALNYLSNGLTYGGNNEEILKIQKSYVDQIRYVSSIVSKITLSFSLSKVFLPPLLSFIFSKDNSKDMSINPYLPLHLYVPFNTERPFGFIIAFISHAVYPFFAYFIIVSHVEVYASVAFQFTAQLEVLCHSLKNIHKRAYFKYTNRKNDNFVNHDNIYKVSGYQRSLLSCLRENVQHHHELIRFNKYACEYLEMTNSLAIAFFSIFMASSTILVAKDPTGNLGLLFLFLLALVAFFIMSWIGELITDKSAEVKDALYTTPWHSCERKFKVLLLTMMTNSQTPIILHAWCFRTSVSLENFGDMMSLAYKILNILR